MDIFIYSDESGVFDKIHIYHVQVKQDHRGGFDKASGIPAEQAGLPKRTH